MEKVKTKKYALLFSDLRMPEKNGIEVCKSVKQISTDTEVVLITGMLNDDTAKKEKNSLRNTF